MTAIEQQLEYFKKLTKDREENAKILEKTSMKGVKTSVVDKYSDQAHFIYELLQNADDAIAKKSKFILTNDGLTFIHNGEINFSVSDPETEDKDTKENNLGHLNAITSIANSNKNESSIGKFGVGFKAVFQYTNTPHIYEPNFKFKIERFIVPQLLTSDFSNRLPNETVFYFPFDLKIKPKEEAYADILQKLKSLVHPVLFLSNLSDIVWETSTESGKYSKKIKETRKIKHRETKEETTCQLINLFDEKDGKQNKKTLWLFTSTIEGTFHKFSVGFSIDKNKKLEPTSYAAFCFFPTKETTNLKFIIQAPFLLTDSREGIKAGEAWNKQLVTKLSNLAADCLPILKQIGIETKSYLIDDNIINVIPFKEADFTPINSRDKISFQPFYTAIKNKLQGDILLPSKNEKYTSKTLSFWASDVDLTDLFSDKQIAELMGKPNSRWVFPTLGRKLVLNEKENFIPVKANYIDSIVGENLDPDKLLRKIDKVFIEKQTRDWLNKFYIYLSDKISYQNLVKKKPIFIGNENIAQSAFDENGSLILFLPSKILHDYPTIHADFLRYPKSIEFFKTFGIGTPSLRDEIYNKIVPQYKTDFDTHDAEKLKTHFLKFFTYFLECPNNHINDYIKQFAEIKFLVCKSKENIGDIALFYPDYCYYPSDILIEYFETKPDTPFIDIAFYNSLVEPEQVENLKTFLIKMGVNELPIIYETQLTLDYTQKQAKGLVTYATRYSRVYDKYIDGCKQIIKSISQEKSFVLWKILSLLIKENNIYQFRRRVQGRHDYFYGIDRTQEFLSTEVFRLTELSSWLINRTGDFVSPSEISTFDLGDGYDIKSPEAIDLIGFLGITNPKEELSALSEEQLLRYELGNKLLREGLSENDLPELLQLYKQKKANQQGSPSAKEDHGNKETPTTENNSSNKESNDVDSSTSNLLTELLAQAKKKIQNEVNPPTLPNSADFWKNDNDDSVEENAGGHLTSPIIGNQYQQDREGKKKLQLEKEIDIEIKRNLLIELAGQLVPYTFQWFKTLLELEDNFTAEDRFRRNPIKVVFGKADIDDDGLLILSETPYIPPTIEDIGEISIQIYFEDDKRTIKGEIVSPQKQKLKVKLSNPDQLNGINLNAVLRVVVESSSPDFILERLKTAFARLEFTDTDNLKSAAIIPSNLKFVFGPPGTGKTSFLSWLIGGKNPDPLIFMNEPVTPLMEQEGKKVLVLTPTNKAADVIVERILSNFHKDNDYPSWLIRFGQSITLEKEDVFIGDKILPSSVYSNCTLVTTIARYPYDYFKIETNGAEFDDYNLRDFYWDVIVFDEASMIQQAALLFVIYYAKQKNPNVEFIIGGDPFQIPPIFQFEYPYWNYLPEPAFDDEGKAILDENGHQVEWRQDGGNIYSFVGLTKDDSFTNPKTEPHQFQIQNLPKQFRSLVPLGELFSNYRYGGKLEHHRKDTAIINNPELAVNPLEVKNLPLSPINIIRFPVKKYGGVFKQQAIKGSPFQIYSAIFSVELIKYIQDNSVIQPEKKYRIGIICPYAKQNLLISKLLEKVGKGKIEVTTGTVHGFQGDECDLVIVVFNPPKNISRSPRCFLNKKNILNVAISRARDKMIILTPYDPDNEINIFDLHQIKRIERLAGKLPGCRDFVTGYESTELEKTLWNNETFIEDNCFTTSHQEVNIYTEAAKRYEIRLDENAIDVQVRLEIFEKKSERLFSIIDEEAINSFVTKE